MDYLSILCGKEEAIPLYDQVVLCLQDITLLPELIEPIFREAGTLNEQLIDKFRFGLLRVQIYSEIHRNMDLEESQKMRYVSEMIERAIFGGLFIERENYVSE
ncbi:MAG TPA: hypothetical protein VN429_01330 [Methanospirillum sp.]|uniref:hypothetical protein n=1 Tax=Methanospirillum sp. TaxID=45200 RepID=UPI002C4D6C67|nr:hypothetical protein [Methanospirillum sp.]HWQ63028.1 hypothetical protein [Methanospirillum sp.]